MHTKEFIYRIYRIFEINWIKTLYLNLKYLPIVSAVKFPILIHRCVNFSKIKGEIVINTPIKTGLLQIGRKSLGTISIKNSHSILELEGKLVVNGKAFFGAGSKICVSENGVLTLGDNFCVTGNSSIICKKQIYFGNDCLLSWEVLVMDTDFHQVINRGGGKIGTEAPIIIGDKVWIGCRNIILKGVKIPNNTVVAAGSVITKSFDECGTIIGGSGREQRVLKTIDHWEL